MRISRKNFIRKSAISLSGIPFIFSGCLSGNGFSSRKRSEISLGVSTSINNNKLLHSLGYHYLEENVQLFLRPLEDEETFRGQYLKFKSSELPVSACANFIPGQFKSVGSTLHHEEILEYVETAFKRAQMCNIRHIVFGSGGSRRIPEDWDEPRAKAQFVSLLKKMAPVAGKYNVVVVVEPLNKREVNFINSLAEGAEIVNMTDHPNVRLLADIFHMMRENEPANEIEKYGKLISHCHIAEKETRSAPGIKGDDFRPYLAALKKIGYKGGLSLECRWDDFNAEVEIAIEYLTKQIQEA